MQLELLCQLFLCVRSTSWGKFLAWHCVLHKNYMYVDSAHQLLTSHNNPLVTVYHLPCLLLGPVLPITVL